MGDVIVELKETINPEDSPEKLYIEYSMPAFDNGKLPDSVYGKNMHSIRKVITEPCVLVNKLNVRKQRIWLHNEFEEDAVCSTEFVALASNGLCSLEYINQLALTERFTVYLLSKSSGTSNSQQRVSPVTILNYGFHLPSLPEQQKIADFLTTYDTMIDTQTKRVEAMKVRKKGLLQKIFSREIRFKDDQGKDYPAWKEIKLGSIVHRVTRKNRNLITKRPLTISAELGLIDQEEFFSKKIASDNLSNYYLLHKGEFAFNRSSATGYPFGAIKRLNRYESGAISTLYICFSVDNSDYSDWLQHFFESTYWHKEAYKVCCEGARNHGLFNISVDDFFSMKLYLPTLPEQQKIADFLTAIDTQIEVEEKRLETMKTIKKGLLQQMFI